MNIVNHHETCAGAPSADGRLRGTCDCSVAPRGAEAQAGLSTLLAQIAQRSIDDGEEAGYLAVRIEILAKQLEKVSISLRFAVDHPDRRPEHENRRKIAEGPPPPANFPVRNHPRRRMKKSTP